MILSKDNFSFLLFTLGWLKTYERYYFDQVRHILNNMVDKLEQYPQMRFIYAEVSFFSMWWSEIDDNRKQRVRKYAPWLSYVSQFV